MIARDHMDELIKEAVRCTRGNVAPEVAEAMGINEALNWVKQNGWHDVEVEADCLIVVQAMRSSAVKLSYLDRTIDEFKQMIFELVN